MIRGRRASVGTGGALTALALVFWEARMVAPVRLPQAVGRWAGDLYTIYYPSFVFAYRGTELLPRWNPHQMAGVPFLAQYNGGFLYPPNWLATVVPVHLALGWLCALHLAFAGVTTFALGRALRLSRPGAATAALAFMLGARFVIEAFRPSYLASIAWVPMVTLLAVRVYARPTAWRGALLGAAVALQLLTGIAQHVVYEAYLLPLAGAVAWAVGPRLDARYVRRLVVAAAVGVLTAAALAAVQLVPTLEVIGAAVRGPGGLTLTQIVPPMAIGVQLRQLVYASGPVLGLVLLGLAAARGRPWVAAAAAVAVVATLIAIGSPLYTEVFYRLPAVRLFRLPQQMAPLGALAAALLAGLGVDVGRRLSTAGSLRIRVAAALVAAGVALATADPARRGAWATLLLVAALAALPLGRRRGLAWVVVAALAIDRFAAIQNRTMIPENNTAAFFRPPPFVEFLRAHAGAERVLVIKNWQRRFPYMEKLGTLWNLRVAQDYEPLTATAYHHFLGGLERWNVDRPLFAGRLQPRADAPAWWALDLLAVRWVVVAPGAPWRPVGDRFRLVYDAADGRIFENTRAQPRARVVEQWRTLPNAAFVLWALAHDRIDPVGLPAVDRADPVQLDPSAPGANDVRVVADRNDEVALRVTSPRGGLVVLADAYWPGWRVTVDGAERGLSRVNFLFRGVTVAPGEHDVRFVYVPVRLYAGAAVSGATVLVLAAWAAARALDSRRRPPRVLVA